MSRNLTAKYLIETSLDVEKAAQMMAGEQSSGTFVKIPGETDELKANHAAQVIKIEIIGECETPTLPGAKRKNGNTIHRAIVELNWPYENIGNNLANLCATIAGNLYELHPFSGLKLLDVEIPVEFTQKYKGPRFGIAGTREKTGVFGRPIIGTIIKPSVGLTPEATADQVKILINAGLDFIKDDELMGDSPHSPFEKRVDLVMDVINKYADNTGKKPMFAFNISGDMDDMLKRHDYVFSKGGTCIMLSMNWVGISAVSKVANHTQLPLHGHRNGWGMFTRCEVLGMDFLAYQKIWRMAGVDHLHTNGIRNKFCESDESVIRSIKACLEPMHGGYHAMPVLASGQWAGQTVDSYNAIKTVDIMYLCGGGIVAHPGGITAGVKSVIQGWEAAVQGIDLQTYAKTNKELFQALEFFKS
ncbi:MAG TPA: ribulose-bisphosphate carboxylase large subunit family protein [bacterium]|nr:ribulose-bisphosphate carboxylase large subunit family protein [bacterium]HPN45570.1 ribulose-bisphosphate carboxylase large subunit family protein [bacterium]